MLSSTKRKVRVVKCPICKEIIMLESSNCKLLEYKGKDFIVTMHCNKRIMVDYHDCEDNGYFPSIDELLECRMVEEVLKYPSTVDEKEMIDGILLALRSYYLDVILDSLRSNIEDILHLLYSYRLSAIECEIVTDAMLRNMNYKKKL